jgi:hypothetical protein
MNVNLFFNYYKSETRQEEIDFCLEMNRKIFDNVIVVRGRPTFKELFDMSKDFPNDINCFCNSDIYFPSIEGLKNIKENECYALTRYDILEGGGLKFFNRPDSQDAWIFKGAVKNIDANFTTGMWGCDNKIAHNISKVGYKITNPSLSIVTVHVHKDERRNHNRTELNTVPPPYKTIQPTLL